MTATPNQTLRRRRQALNLSQAELAERIRNTGRTMSLNLACDEKRVGRWERGEVRWPSPAYRRVLCAVFGVDNVARLGFTGPGEAIPVTAHHRRADPVHCRRRGAYRGTALNWTVARSTIK